MALSLMFSLGLAFVVNMVRSSSLGFLSVRCGLSLQNLQDLLVKTVK